MRHALCALLLLPALARAAEFPPTTHKLSDCENRWFLKEAQRPNVRLLGFAYVDPDAGVTIEVNGDVAISQDGTLQRTPGSYDKDRRLIIRGMSNLEIACLSDELASQLGLPLVPAWLAFYKDKRAPGPHNVAWASYYNHIGAFEKALEFLQLASDAGFQSAELSYERGFALNATGQFQEALGGLEIAVQAHPDSVALLGEFAFAHMKLRAFKRAIELYETALLKDKEGKSGRRAEFAHNIAMAFAALGDDQRAHEWREKAESWKGERGR